MGPLIWKCPFRDYNRGSEKNTPNLLPSDKANFRPKIVKNNNRLTWYNLNGPNLVFKSWNTLSGAPSSENTIDFRFAAAFTPCLRTALSFQWFGRKWPFGKLLKHQFAQGYNGSISRQFLMNPYCNNIGTNRCGLKSGQKNREFSLEDFISSTPQYLESYEPLYWAIDTITRLNNFSWFLRKSSERQILSVFFLFKLNKIFRISKYYIIKASVIKVNLLIRLLIHKKKKMLNL